MKEPAPNNLRHAIARRLRALQRVANATEQQMADYVGVSRSAWSNATRENGTSVNKPSEEAMVRLCERSKVTMEWIYRGNYDQMPHALAEALQAELGEADAALSLPVRLHGLARLE